MKNYGDISVEIGEYKDRLQEGAFNFLKIVGSKKLDESSIGENLLEFYLLLNLPTSTVKRHLPYFPAYKN